VKFWSVESNAYTRWRPPAPTITCPSDAAHRHARPTFSCSSRGSANRRIGICLAHEPSRHTRAARTSVVRFAQSEKRPYR
jgi:hypothetical protein